MLRACSIGSLFLATASLMVLSGAPRAEQYILNLDQGEHRAVTSWLKAGGSNPKGQTLSVNSLYWSRNRTPWLPIMGEFHFYRFPAEQWERQLLTMKAGGVSIVSTYVFWEISERPRGQWNWSGQNDLRRFVELCKKHGLYVWLRPGPYVNGEVLNRGIPDWAWKLHARTNDPDYLAAARAYFLQVGAQVRGLLFKDGGPIIGCQLENEYASGSKDHLVKLREYAMASGIDVPFFSATANSEYHYELGDVLPLQGAYPYRYWEAPRPTGDFLYATDEWGAMQNLGRLYYDVQKFPRGMCELGGGSLTGTNWRYSVPPYDMEGSTQNVLGRGCNLVGYYMFQGGTHRFGEGGEGLGLSFDYQAPLGEFGQVRPSYHALKLLHLFAQDFGKDLAPMQPVRPEHMIMDPTDVRHARFAGRFSGPRGFVFATTCQPRVATRDALGVQFRVLSKGRSMVFPASPIRIPRDTSPIFPVNMDVNGTNLKYATAQPLMALSVNGVPCYVFFAHDGIKPEFCFSSGTVQSHASRDSEHAGVYFPTAGRRIAFNLTALDGRRANVIVLSRSDALKSWKINFRGTERLLLSDANLAETADGTGITLASYENKMSLDVFPATNSHKGALFQEFHVSVPKTTLRWATTALPSPSWSVTPSKLPEHVRDVLVQVSYTGSGATLTPGAARHPYTDHRLVGPPFEFSVRRFAINQPLHVQALPWDPSVSGIASESMPKSETERKGSIRTVRMFPEYVAFLR